ncbi:hypothetical protein BGZ65_002241 [Modicella reniformis]|uniref:F-box domain-containing protein n=1 Tax=Modicella reniformis TaxID=1440133 RepID=A0A9P6J451_9FUNG|nr:hypothetical protein BGZ65_002241 [Modicella reniformis]
MSQPAAALRALPTELLIRIFTLSSNPSLILVCRELNHILAPVSKSTAIRTEFLLVRYRNNYVKAVVKGLRWTFFDLDVLEALDRLYQKGRPQQLCNVKLASHSQSNTSTTGDRSSFMIQHFQEALNMPASIHVSLEPNLSASQASEPQEPLRKKRKKYHLAPALDLRHTTMDHDYSNMALSQLEASSFQESKIPLPKDFAMPRRLFKSSDYLPLIKTLLSRGASPSHPSHYPLVRASQRGDVEMVKTLLAFGAPLEIKALRWACVEEKDEVIDVFLDRGVKPDDQCLSWCVEKGKTRMIDRLLKLGVVPDLKTVLGF